jgi:hypothetical protein
VAWVLRFVVVEVNADAGDSSAVVRRGVEHTAAREAPHR